MKTKQIFLKVPETEHVKFKVFASSRQITLQLLIRKAVNFYIESVKKADREDRERTKN